MPLHDHEYPQLTVITQKSETENELRIMKKLLPGQGEVAAEGLTEGELARECIRRKR